MSNIRMMKTLLVICLCVYSINISAQDKGSRYISTNGYDSCIEIYNGIVRVVLEPNCGGRVLYYEKDSVNALYINPEQDGIVYEGKYFGEICAGRFDIGPEMLVGKRTELLVGKWEAEITGDYSARLTSPISENIGVQLIREFSLAPNSSQLSCKQIIKNISEETKRYNFWARTFADSRGILLCPLNPNSRYPKKYLDEGPGKHWNYLPKPTENVRVREGVLEILDIPLRSKYAIDVSEGWLGYITRKNLLFVKTFPVYPDKIYGEICANNVSIWYGKETCEIEPIGPWEIIKPGESASFTENWWLYNFNYPIDKTADLNKVKNIIKKIQ